MWYVPNCSRIHDEMTDCSGTIRLIGCIADLKSEQCIKGGVLDYYEVFYHKHKFSNCTWNM